MRKILFLILILISVSISAQTDKSYTREGNTFILSKGERKSTKSTIKQTPYVWKDGKGASYPIWITEKSGSCFIIRVTKDGKEYRSYLNVEICKEICKELNIEYKGKSKNVKND